MAIQKFEKGSPEWGMFGDFWKFCQQIWIPEDADEYWERVVQGMKDFHNKYKGVDEVFARHIMLAIEETVEEKAKRQRRKSQA